MPDYYESEQQHYTFKLQKIAKDLPLFINIFFRGIDAVTSAKTRLSYAYDLRLFFTFILPLVNKENLVDITLDDLKAIRAIDIDEFLTYLTKYSNNSNGAKGKARKLAAVRSLFKFFYRQELFSSNPAALVSTPKIHESVITRLESNELADLLDVVESGGTLNDRQLKFHAHTKTRDLALISLLAGTGMRVSECVGIDISHFNFEESSVCVTRKGGNKVLLYFGDEVQNALMDYMVERGKIGFETEKAFFLSLRKSRITVRSVEYLVEKYARMAVLTKTISPHKLRSTFGTNLYKETGDIYLVAEVLGHKDVNTTRKHYAEIEQDARRRAAKYIRLRSES